MLPQGGTAFLGIVRHCIAQSSVAPASTRRTRPTARAHRHRRSARQGPSAIGVSGQRTAISEPRRACVEDAPPRSSRPPAACKRLDIYIGSGRPACCADHPRTRARRLVEGERHQVHGSLAHDRRAAPMHELPEACEERRRFGNVDAGRQCDRRRRRLRSAAQIPNRGGGEGRRRAGARAGRDLPGCRAAVCRMSAAQLAVAGPEPGATAMCPSAGSGEKVHIPAVRRGHTAPHQRTGRQSPACRWRYR
jgi:hypothetical protein